MVCNPLRCCIVRLVNRLVSLSLALLVACGHGESPAGRELATVSGSPISLMVVGDQLIVHTRDPESYNQLRSDKTVRQIVISVDISDGTVREIARPPVGELAASIHGIVYATTAGELVLLQEGGHTRKLAQIYGAPSLFHELIAPVWDHGDVLAIAHEPDRSPDAFGPIRIDTRTGAVTRLNVSFTGPTASAHAIADASGVYFIDRLSGETLRVVGDRVERIEGPSGHVTCAAIVGSRLWWIQYGESPPMRLMSMPFAGGKVTTAAQLHDEGDCTGAGDQLIFSDGRRILAIKDDQPPRTIVTSRHPIDEVAATAHAVFWTEGVEPRFPDRYWIRTAPLH